MATATIKEEPVKKDIIMVRATHAYIYLRQRTKETMKWKNEKMYQIHKSYRDLGGKLVRHAVSDPSEWWSTGGN